MRLAAPHLRHITGPTRGATVRAPCRSHPAASPTRASPHPSAPERAHAHLRRERRHDQSGEKALPIQSAAARWAAAAPRGRQCCLPWSVSPLRYLRGEGADANATPRAAVGCTVGSRGVCANAASSLAAAACGYRRRRRRACAPFLCRGDSRSTCGHSTPSTSCGRTLKDGCWRIMT